MSKIMDYCNEIIRVIAFKAPSYFVGIGEEKIYNVDGEKKMVRNIVLLYYNGDNIFEYVKDYKDVGNDTTRIDFRISKLTNKDKMYITEKSWFKQRVTKEEFAKHLDLLLKEKQEFEKELLNIE